MAGLSSSPASVVKMGSSAKCVSTCHPGGHSNSLPKVWSFLFDVKWTRLTRRWKARVSGSEAGEAPR